MGKGGCTAAGRAARSKAQGQPDLSEGCIRRDDAYKVPQAHFYVEIADRAPLPRIGEGGRGCGAERRQWRMQRGGAPVAVEKIEQASSAKIFSGTARRQGLRFAEEWAAEEILDQVGGRLAAGVALCKALGARLPGGGVPFL